MCQVHTGAYVSLHAPEKTDCHVYITRTNSTYHYACARQSQVNREKKRNEEKERKKKKRKESERERKEKTRQDKKRKQGKNKEKNVILADPRNLLDNGRSPVAPVAYQVIPEPGISQLREN